MAGRSKMGMNERKSPDDIAHARYLLSAMALGREGEVECGMAMWVCDCCLRVIHDAVDGAPLACECGRTYAEVKAARIADDEAARAAAKPGILSMDMGGKPLSDRALFEALGRFNDGMHPGSAGPRIEVTEGVFRAMVGEGVSWSVLHFRGERRIVAVDGMEPGTLWCAGDDACPPGSGIRMTGLAEV
jgi:hypothetical protein